MPCDTLAAGRSSLTAQLNHERECRADRHGCCRQAMDTEVLKLAQARCVKLELV